MSSAEVRRRRRQFLLQLSYVTWVKAPSKCDGKRYRVMPFRAYVLDDPKFHCKNIAHWKFRPVKIPNLARGHQARAGTYCWSHLYAQGFFANPSEERRFRTSWTKWLTKNPPPLEGTYEIT